MRAPDFWDRDDALSRLAAGALSPAAALYNATVRWKAEHTLAYRPRIPVVCIGNISSGGTGKTPTAIAVAEALKRRDLAPVFLTRGYGGKLQGPSIVGPEHNAGDVGDEPLLLARAARTVVSRDRRAGAMLAENMADVIVMDDGHQNFRLAKDLSIVVVDAETGFGNGRVIPAGPLRETARQGLSRADAVVLMGDGNPDLPGFTGPVLRARLEASGADEWRGRRVLAFAGIGRPSKFFRTLQQAGADLTAMIAFPDHHPFTPGEIERLKRQARDNNSQLVTTEKDLVRVSLQDRTEINALAVRAVIEPKTELDRLLDRLTASR